MVFEQPEPSSETHRRGDSLLRKLAPSAALGAGLIILIILVKLAF